MKIVIDIGNTASKFGCVNDGVFFFLGRLYNHDVNLENVKSIFKDIDRVKGVYISSVAPKICNLIAQIFKDLYDLEVCLVSSSMSSRVQLAIDNKYELGTDLYCDLVAAYEISGAKTAIVDFGTATKILFIDENGSFSSCAIFLGYEKSKNILSKSTELLPDPAHRKILPISECHNTVDVINSSAYYSQLFTINGIIDEYEKEVGYSLKRIYTGGNAKDFLPNINENEYDENLVLKGIMILIESEQK